jgi:predicted PurR-regulated permease PerM
MWLIKIVLGLFLILLIGVLTWHFAIVGLLIGFAMAFILNNMIDRYERKRTNQTA